jgi:hypothetical protein
VKKFSMRYCGIRLGIRWLKGGRHLGLDLLHERIRRTGHRNLRWSGSRPLGPRKCGKQDPSEEAAQEFPRHPSWPCPAAALQGRHPCAPQLRHDGTWSKRSTLSHFDHLSHTSANLVFLENSLQIYIGSNRSHLSLRIRWWRVEQTLSRLIGFRLHDGRNRAQEQENRPEKFQQNEVSRLDLSPDNKPRASTIVFMVLMAFAVWSDH